MAAASVVARSTAAAETARMASTSFRNCAFSAARAAALHSADASFRPVT
ncbi:hypothetical protein [Shinella sp.]|nr:hypothetical protein [Shinella sp.]MCW5711280.1 hypothetical protein [Shinella sp.]